MKILTWQDFDEFWEALEASHAETPYTFDAYDEEVARVAFKAGRESMRRQVVAIIEHLLVADGSTKLDGVTQRSTSADPSQLARTEALREIVDDVDLLAHVESN